jgi:hypothetical protein
VMAAVVEAGRAKVMNANPRELRVARSRITARSTTGPK